MPINVAHNLTTIQTSHGATVAKSLEIRLLGGFEVRVSGNLLPPSRFQTDQWLLARLVLLHGKDVTREWLARMIWPDRDQEQAMFYLRKALSTLKNGLDKEGDRLRMSGSRTIRLDLTGANVDVIAFDDAIRSPEVKTLTHAVSLYTGPFLPDCPEAWATQERAKREQAHQAAVDRLREVSLQISHPMKPPTIV